MKKSEIEKTIFELIKLYYTGKKSAFVPGKTKIPLICSPYSWEEVNQAMSSLLRCEITLNQFQGNKVGQFEDLWSSYLGVNNSIMVNSGSSANLLALFILANPTTKNRIYPGAEIITPAVTWHTTVSPILAINAIPVFVDITLDDFTIDVELIEPYINKNTKAIMPVHLLGNPCDMDKIMKIAKEYDLFVIEDTCEAHGAKLGNKYCGSMGDIGTFSFFFSHHITTMEGGMIVTNNDDFAELGRIMRSQGVIRNTRRKKELTKFYKNSSKYCDLDPLYLFANIGFNLRPTELNGGFGVEQMKKIESVLEIRRKNGLFWNKELSDYKKYIILPEKFKTGSSWFCYPIVIKDDAPFSRTQLMDHLIENNIEVRPIMSGNITRHPALEHFPYNAGELPVADVVHKNGFFWGNHQGIDGKMRDYICDIINDFLSKY